MWRLKHFVVTLMMLLCVAVARGADDPPATKKPGHQRWAILVGVDDYVELKDLNYCGADQKALHARLQAAGFPEDHLFLLHDKATENRFKPFKANIEKQLKLLLSLVEKDDLVVIGFSGHGIQIEKTAYLCPADANIEKPESLLSLPEIYEQLEKSPAALRLMIVDACRDDPRPRGKRSAATIEELTEFSKATPPRGILWLGSCGPGQQSQEDDELKHGVFMHYLLEGWGGKADKNSDGQVSLGELSAFAAAETKKHVARKYGDFQSPYLKGEYEQEILQFDIGRVARGAEAKLTNAIGMELVLIPAGEFEMGDNSDGPVHRVAISQPFYLGVYEVTQSQYERVVGTNPSYFSKTGRGKDKVSGLDTSDCPVETVSWNDAQAFCRKLSALSGEQTVGREYRLPTEAEWEYACRAGTKSNFHFGDALNGDKANVDGSSPAGTTTKGPYLKRTTTVGRYAANAFGLYDMHGNVWEWCEDVADEKAYSKRSGLTTNPLVTTNPLRTSESYSRVMRGGSWSAHSLSARSARRSMVDPSAVDNQYGLRVVCASGARTR